jgi:hypothetical protein
VNFLDLKNAETSELVKFLTTSFFACTKEKISLEYYQTTFLPARHTHTLFFYKISHPVHSSYPTSLRNIYKSLAIRIMYSSSKTATVTYIVTVLSTSTRKRASPTFSSAFHTKTRKTTKYATIPQTHHPFKLSTVGEPWNPSINIAYYFLIVVLPVFIACNFFWYLYHGLCDRKRRRAQLAKKKRTEPSPQTGVTDEVGLDMTPPICESDEGFFTPENSDIDEEPSRGFPNDNWSIITTPFQSMTTIACHSSCCSVVVRNG